MRISTSSLFDRSAASMASLSDRADRLNTQISTGVRITKPSDDAAAWRQVASIRRASADQVADTANVKLAQGLLASSDGALEGIETQLQRAHEIAVLTANGTLSDAQKASYAIELDGIAEDMLKLANTQDARGQPLFGGATGDVAYTKASDGTISYAGTGEPAAIPISDGASVQATTSGPRIFEGIATPSGTSDIFAIVQGLAAAIRTGGTTSSTASSEAITSLKTSVESVTSARASVGARAARLDIESARLADVAIDREDLRSSIEDTDVPTTYLELQKTMTVLSATQASFSKLTSLSLFDYLR